MSDWSFVDPALHDSALLEELTGIIRTASVPIHPIPTGIETSVPVPPGIRAVLFDLYGTLFVSGSGDIGISRDAAADDHFLTALPAAGVTLRSPSAGASARERFTAAIRDTHRFRKERGTEWPEVDILSIWHAVLTGLIEAHEVEAELSYPLLARLAVRYEVLSNPVSPMPFARELLDAYRESGIPTGIVSNAQFYTPLLFPAFFGCGPEDLGFLPEASVYSYRMQEAKPSPGLFAAAAHGLHRTCAIEPGEILFVGNDMRNDVAAAASAGMRTCLFAGDRRSLRLRTEDARTAGVRPDMTIAHLRDLLRVPDPGYERKSV